VSNTDIATAIRSALAAAGGRMDRAQLLNSHAGDGILRRTSSITIDSVLEEMTTLGALTVQGFGFNHVELAA